MKYIAKSVIFGRKPRVQGDDFKSAFFKIYDCLDPLQSADFPVKELDFPNIEKVEIQSIDLDYYLEGNDLVIDGIAGIIITQHGTVLSLSVEK